MAKKIIKNLVVPSTVLAVGASVVERIPTGNANFAGGFQNAAQLMPVVGTVVGAERIVGGLKKFVVKKRKDNGMMNAFHKVI